jgi:hypothetical protein
VSDRCGCESKRRASVKNDSSSEMNGGKRRAITRVPQHDCMIGKATGHISNIIHYSSRGFAPAAALGDRVLQLRMSNRCLHLATPSIRNLVTYTLHNSNTSTMYFLASSWSPFKHRDTLYSCTRLRPERVPDLHERLQLLITGLDQVGVKLDEPLREDGDDGAASVCKVAARIPMSVPHAY